MARQVGYGADARSELAVEDSARVALLHFDVLHGPADLLDVDVRIKRAPAAAEEATLWRRVGQGHALEALVVLAQRLHIVLAHRWRQVAHEYGRCAMQLLLLMLDAVGRCRLARAFVLLLRVRIVVRVIRVGVGAAFAIGLRSCLVNVRAVVLFALF